MNTAIQLPQSLINRLSKLTEGTRSTPTSIVKKAVQEHLDYEEWLMSEVDAGIADADAGRTISHEEFWKEIEGARRGKK
ncbi:MAG: hypothetical protein HOO97_05595 [Sideroxydans sp.]|nr:hypothetical protein [Sideroxydans sp.]